MPSPLGTKGQRRKDAALPRAHGQQLAEWARAWPALDPMSQLETLTKPAPLSRCPLTMVPGVGETDRTEEGLGARSRNHKVSVRLRGIRGSRAWRLRPAPPAEAIWSQALALALAARMWLEL